MADQPPSICPQCNGRDGKHKLGCRAPKTRPPADGPPFNSWRKLLGKNVVVRLDEQVVTRGRLIALDDGGEAKLVDEMGFVHYVWPMLDVTEDQ